MSTATAARRNAGASELPAPAVVDAAPAWLAPLTRAGERVAVVETKTDALRERFQEDAAHIRQSLHSIAGFLQGSGRAEVEQKAALQRIEDKFDNAVQQINTKVDGLAGDVKAMMTKVDALESARDKTVGIWWAIVRVGAVLAAVISFLGGTAAIIGWLLAHHAELVLH